MPLYFATLAGVIAGVVGALLPLVLIIVIAVIVAVVVLVHRKKTVHGTCLHGILNSSAGCPMYPHSVCYAATKASAPKAPNGR